MKTLLTLLGILACVGSSAVGQTTCNASMNWTQMPNSYSVTFTNSSNVAPALPPSPIAATTRFVIIGGQYYPSSPSYTHTFAGPGTYTATAYVGYVDSVGMVVLTCQDTMNYSVVVAPQPCYAVVGPITANGMTRTFTANNGVATPGTVYSWNFGDGSPIATGVSATHTYASGGSYTVTLTATGNGCTNSVNTTQWLPANSINCSTATTSISSLLTYGSAMFSAYTNTGWLIGIHEENQWNFGDGTPTTQWSNSGGANHWYTAPGTYTVSLSTRWIDSATNTIICTKNATANVTVALQGIIAGSILWDSTLVANAAAKVWLISYDPQTTMLSAIDSTVVSGSGSAPFAFQNIPAGIYRTKAHLLNQVAGSAGFVPTYRDSSLTWSAAQSFNHNGSVTQSGVIYIRQGLVTSGAGFVGGSVLSGANKGTADGDPVVNQLVFLRNAATGSLVQSAYTNIAGQYSFSNVPLGSYTVYPEEMNYATTPSAPLTLTASSASVSGILFKKDDVDMDIKQVTTSVNDVAAGNVAFTVIPNPTTGKLALSVVRGKASMADVRVLSVTGQVVFASSINTASTTDLDLSHLPSGVYSMLVATETGLSNVRVVIAR